MPRLVLLLLIFSAGIAQAQQSRLEESASCEGEIVASIDVVADPHVDVAPYQAKVLQQPGQTCSQEKIQASVLALQQTGKFAKVRTMATLEPKGVRLSFVLEPAYYIGIVDFPEAAKHFSYIRLLQTVNFSSEAPYDKAVLPDAETALQNFLKSEGYFQATIHTETSLDDTNQLVDIVFHTNLGPRARIGQIQIEGTTPAETVRLLHSLRSLRARFSGGLLKPGKTYSAERLKAATTLVKKTLSSQHYLAAKVQQLPPQYIGAINRVNISFRIEPGPVVLVTTTGARLSAVPFLSGIQRKKLIPIYSEGSIDRDLVDEGQQNLIDYFQKKGYFDVQVKTNVTREPGKVFLTYVIDKGRKHKVSTIVIEGNHALSAGNLLAHIPVKKSHIWTHGDYSAKLLKTSTENMEALYHDAGYEDVKVTANVVDHEPQLDVTFHVAEGPQTVVQKVSINGNAGLSHETLAGKSGFQLRSGGPFSPGKLASDRNQISAAYLEHGYLNAEVKAEVARQANDPHRVEVTYQITEHQMVRMQQVLYEGQKHTRLALIRKATGLRPETPLNEKQLLQSQTNLYDLDIFDWTSVGPKRPISDQTDEDAIVKVHEAKRTEIIYGFGFEVSHRGGNIPAGTVAVPGLPPVNIGNKQVAPSQGTFASPRGSIEIVRHNMRGLAETVSLSLLASRLDQKALASYADPHFRETNWSSLTSFSFER